MVSVEDLAKALHEAGREAVEKKAVVNPNTFSKFLEWGELKEHMKEGRRIQARYLTKYFDIIPKLVSGIIHTKF